MWGNKLHIIFPHVFCTFRFYLFYFCMWHICIVHACVVNVCIQAWVCTSENLKRLEEAITCPDFWLSDLSLWLGHLNRAKLCWASPSVFAPSSAGVSGICNTLSFYIVAGKNKLRSSWFCRKCSCLVCHLLCPTVFKVGICLQIVTFVIFMVDNDIKSIVLNVYVFVFMCWIVTFKYRDTINIWWKFPVNSINC